MKELRPSACLGLGYWDWVWVTLGSPKGHARATQGPRKGHPCAMQASIGGSAFVCNENKKVAGGVGFSAEGTGRGLLRIAEIAVIAGIAVIGKPLNHKGHEGTQS